MRLLPVTTQEATFATAPKSWVDHGISTRDEVVTDGPAVVESKLAELKLESPIRS
jgi:hypothetical protein